METYWQYFITLNDNMNQYNFGIVSVGNVLEFSDPILTTLIDGKKTLLFTSLNPVVLEKSHDIDLSLVRIDISGQNQNLVMRLPIPSPDIIHEDESGKLYSPVYIFI